MYYSLLFSPLVGGLIGWMTNVLAIKLIFRPYQPYKIPLLNYTVQGLIPRRKEEIAKILGEVIERELISLDDVMKNLKSQGLQEKMVYLLIPSVRQAVANRLPQFLPTSVREVIASAITEIIGKEASKVFNNFSWEVAEELKEQLSFAQIIERKINEMDWLGLESLVLQVVHKELRHIEVLGGVLGFIIGLFQALFYILFFQV